MYFWASVNIYVNLPNNLKANSDKKDFNDLLLFFIRIFSQRDKGNA